MTHYDFDTVIPRRESDSVKWNAFDPDVLPLWVADMDFRSPEPVLRALHERIDHGIFGYAFGSEKALAEAIAARMADRHHWSVNPEHIVFMPNLFYGLYAVSRAYAEADNGRVLIQTPVYGPFISAPGNAGRPLQVAELTAARANGHLRYEIDFDAFEAAITPDTRVFLMCSPHNPVGRVWERWELERMADICLRHNLVIVSDEIHADLIYNGHRHIPTAALSPEVCGRTVTLHSASKAFNLPGLALGYAIVLDDNLRRSLQAVLNQANVHSGLMGAVATLAAYREGQPWLDALVQYLQGNRDYLLDYVARCLPQIGATHPEGTYLAWLDCRAAGIDGKPSDFFLKQAKVALNDGAWFGQGGEGFVRLNYGCPRATLTEALERMRAALAAL